MRDDIRSQLENIFDSLATLATGMITAIIVVLIARYLHRFVRNLLLRRFESPNLSESGRTVIDVMTTVVFVVVTITVLLGLWGVTWSGIIAAIGLGAFGLLLGVQDVLKSLIGGIFLLLEHPYSIGDRIAVRDVKGRVIGIELRTTIIRSDEGHRIVAPNSIVFTDTLTNYSLRRQIRTSLILAGARGNPADLRATIEREIAIIEGVDGPVEVHVRSRSAKAKTPIRSAQSSVGSEAKSTAQSAEVWISWLGGGELEVQAKVVARLKELYPEAKVRAKAVRGMAVHQAGEEDFYKGG
jgi:small-conductance mechanosensitive channel